jgi:hypothetical protein
MHAKIFLKEKQESQKIEGVGHNISQNLVTKVN